MWNILVLTVLAGLTAFYSMADKEGMDRRELMQASNLADSMAQYREATATYFALHPTQYGSIAIDALKAAGALPSWSTLYTQPETSIWANYRDDDGMIYIYAASLPAVNIVSEVVALSQNSVLAGVFRTGDTTLYSPVFGDTLVKLPPAAEVAIPDGSPVWIAMRK